MYSRKVYDSRPVYVKDLKDMKDYISTQLDDDFSNYVNEHICLDPLFDLMYQYSDDNTKILKEIIDFIKQCQINFFENEKGNWHEIEPWTKEKEENG